VSFPVIKVENLGKKYLIRHQQRERYVALRDVMANSVKNVGRKLFSPRTSNLTRNTTREDFWALKDVSFEINQGDRVGIIGRNGAGKTTLLKLISRITEPTTGRIVLKGRVASLLEVGTGFHPELTGRENIFLNGAILGMSKAEIKKKFDEIVDFAEVEKFLDTPVKRYSSGMYVRLAFAVAAHLEPEILLVDEVLAVGDYRFQDKCLGKMKKLGESGRTVLFVSHNMDALNNLCERGILLNKGCLEADNSIGSVTKKYMEGGDRINLKHSWSRSVNMERSSSFISVKMMNEGMEETCDFTNEEDIIIEIKYEQRSMDLRYRIVLTIFNEHGFQILMTSNAELLNVIALGINTFYARIHSPLLTKGTYYVNVRLDVPFLAVFDQIENCVSFNITENRYHQMGMIGRNEFLGCVHVSIAWKAHNL
jgi:lipopolysaccharide transport system ATP-binding protein